MLLQSVKSHSSCMLLVLGWALANCVGAHQPGWTTHPASRSPVRWRPLLLRLEYACSQDDVCTLDVSLSNVVSGWSLHLGLHGSLTPAPAAVLATPHHQNQLGHGMGCCPFPRVSRWGFVFAMSAVCRGTSKG